MRALASIVTLLIVVGTTATISAQKRPAPVLQLSQTIVLPGVKGGFDHFAYDPLHGRLLLAAEDNGTVEVIDLKRAARIKSITGFKNPHSILFRSGASVALVTDSGLGASALLDTTTFQKMGSLKLAVGANCILFDHQKKVVYVTAGGDRVGERTSSLLAVDPDTGRVLNSVKVDALHLQPMALDAQTGRLFVNLADQTAIGIYDRESLARIGTWRIPMGRGNSPIAFDPKQRRLFVVASEPGILLELDADSGKLKSSIATPQSPDDMALDTGTGRVFVPGSGALSVYDVSLPEQIKLVEQVQTGQGTRTGILFASATKYAVAVPAAGNVPARVLIFDVRR